LPGSGKGEFSRCARDLGIPVLVMGDVIRRVAMERGLPADDATLGGISGELRKELGRGAVALLMIDAIRGLGAPVVLVDGIRSDAEVVEFRRAFPGFALVGVTSPFEARLARLRARERTDDIAGTEALARRDERELGWGLGTALAGAEVTVENAGSLDAFRREVRCLLASLSGGA